MNRFNSLLYRTGSHNQILHRLPHATTTAALIRCSSTTSNSEYRRFAVEMGTGTSLRREDHTAAAVRAVQDALWQVSLTAYRALDQNPNDMNVHIIIGVPKPDEVKVNEILALVPYGKTSISVELGGLSIKGGCGADAQGNIIMANAAVQVDLDVGDYLEFKRTRR